MHDLSWADSYPEIYGIAFVRGVEPVEALQRIGGFTDTLAERTPMEIVEMHDFDHGYPEVVSALALGEWTMLLQPASFWLGHLAAALSRGTEAFATTRHEYANPAFAYAVNGTIVTGFNPWYPDDRYGTEPDRLLPRMKEAGFDPDDEDGQYRQSTSRSLRLIGSVTGVLPTADQVNGPLPSMQFDHWFSRTRPSSSENDPCTG